MKRPILAAALLLCLTIPTIAGDIDGTGKTPPPPPPPCTENCTSSQTISVKNQIRLQLEILIALLPR
jgi:hypothetical protein